MKKLIFISILAAFVLVPFVIVDGQTTVYIRRKGSEPTPTPTPTPGVAVVQTAASATDAAATPVTATFGDELTGGNRIVVIVIVGNPEYLTVTDSQTNTYTVRASSPSNWSDSLEVVVLDTIADAGANTVTATMAASYVYGLAVFELSGSATGYDSTLGWNELKTQTSNPINAPEVTPSASGAVVLAIFRKVASLSTWSSSFPLVAPDWELSQASYYEQETAGPIQISVTPSSAPTETYPASGGAVAYLP